MMDFVYLFILLLPWMSYGEEIEVNIREETDVMKVLDIHSSYRMAGENKLFTLNGGNILRNINEIDREVVGSLMEFSLISEDVDPRVISVKIHVEDINDNPPLFDNKTNLLIHLQINEGTPIGTKFHLPRVTDADEAANGISDNIAFVDDVTVFRLLLERGDDDVTNDHVIMKLQTTETLDREKQDNYMLTIRAIDEGNPPLIGHLIVNVTISDINDNHPEFTQLEYDVMVWENHTIGDDVITVHAVDADQGLNGLVSYRLSNTSSLDDDVMFEVDEWSGNVRLLRELDHEVRNLHRIFIEAFDHGNPRQIGRTSVAIRVGNINDNNPQIDFSFIPSTSSIASVNEDVIGGELILFVSATDPDISPSSSIDHIEIDIVNGNELGDFKLEKFSTYKPIVVSLVVARNITLRRHQSYNITFRARDLLGSGETHRSVTIYVNSPNAHSPKFSDPTALYRATVDELAPTGSYVTCVHATDDDFGTTGNLIYEITSGNSMGWFAIDQQSGMITTTSTTIIYVIDNDIITLIIQARDQSDEPRSSEAKVIIQIRDVNNHPPVFDDVTITTYISHHMTTPNKIAIVEGSDDDTGSAGDVTYHLKAVTSSNGVRRSAGGAGIFNVSRTDGVLWLVTTTPIDDDVSAYDVIVEARDSGSPPLVSEIQVRVEMEGASPKRSSLFYPSVYYVTLAPGYHSNRHVATVTTTAIVTSKSYVVAARTSPSTRALFAVDRVTGRVITKSAAFHRGSFYTVYVTTTSSDDDVTMIHVVVTDTSNERIFPHKQRHKVILENDVITEPLFSFARGSDVIDYTIQNGDPNGDFRLKLSDTRVHVHLSTNDTMTTVDRETNLSPYNLTLVGAILHNNDVVTDFGVTSLIVAVMDVNDNWPIFTRSLYNHTTSQYVDTCDVWLTSGGRDDVIYDAAATDADEGANSRLYYVMKDARRWLAVDSASGAVRLRRDFNDDVITSRWMMHVVKVEVCDGGAPRHCSDLRLEVRIIKNLRHFIPTKMTSSVQLSDDDVIVANVLAPFHLPVMLTDRDDVINTSPDHVVASFRLSSSEFGVTPHGVVFAKRKVSSLRNQEFIEVLASLRDRVTTAACDVTLVVSRSPRPRVVVAREMEFNVSLPLSRGDVIGVVGGREVNFDTPLRYVICDGGQTDKWTPTRDVAVEVESGQLTAVRFIAEPFSPSTIQICTFASGESPKTKEIHKTTITINFRKAEAEVATIALVRRIQVDVFENATRGDVIYANNHVINGTIHRLQINDIAIPFRIHPHTGDMTLTSSSLDREERDHYRFICDVMSSGDVIIEELRFLVRILDVNDCAPQFSTSEEIHVREDVAPRTVIGRIHARDPDLVGDITYELMTPSQGAPFAVDDVSGNVILLQKLDREMTSSYTLNVRASDGVTSSRSDVIVIVDDANDNRPEFDLSATRCYGSGDHQVDDTPVCRVRAIDADEGATVRYDVIKERDLDDGVAVDIDAESGEIRVRGSVDYGRYQPHGYFLVTVIASDVSDDGRAMTSSFVRLPIFVDGDSIVTSSLGLVVRRSDLVVGFVVYEFTSDDIVVVDDVTTFQMASQRKLVMRRKIVEEREISVHLRRRHDGLEIELTLIIMEENEVLFRDDGHQVSLLQSPPIGSEIISLKSAENSSTFHIINATTTTMMNNEIIQQPFTIDNTGVITNIISFVTSYTITVATVTKQQVTLSQIEVSVVNDNHHAPVLDSILSNYDVIESAQVGDVVTRLSASDGDDDVIAYSLEGDDVSDYVIDSSTGLLQVARNLDREKISQYLLRVKAFDGKHTTIGVFTITLLDVNDNSPKFEQDEYFFNITESTTTKQKFVGVITATDDDIIDNLITYSIIAGNDEDIFTIDQFGLIKTWKNFDRETKDFYPLLIRAQDEEGLNCDVYVFINVLDVNDNSPKFHPNQTTKFLVKANSPRRTVIGKLLDASDDDIGMNGIVKYDVISGNGSSSYEIDPKTLEIRTLQSKLSAYECYMFRVAATDQSTIISARMTSYIDIYVDVIADETVRKPPTIIAPSKWFVAEDATPDYDVIQLAIDDENDNGKLLEIIRQPSPSYFSISNTNTIKLMKPLNREVVDRINVTLAIINSSKSDVINMEIIVDDVNDNPPIFAHEDGDVIVQLRDDVTIHDKLTRLIASDMDIGRNGVVFYRIIQHSTNSLNVVDIDVVSGDLYLASIPDDDVTITVQAYDGGSPTMTSQVNVTILMSSLLRQHHQQSCSCYFVQVEENRKNVELLRVDDVMLDTVTIMTSSSYIQPSFFRLSSDGRLVLVEEVDREKCGEIDLEISSSLGGVSAIYVHVEILDVDEFTPIMLSELHRYSVLESADISTSIGHIQVIDEDAADAGVITFSIQPSNQQLPFLIDPTLGEITVSEELDREKIDFYEFEISATDGHHQVSARVFIQILDVDDNKARFEENNFIFYISNQQVIGEICGVICAYDDDLNSQINYQIFNIQQLPFLINSSTGVITSSASMTSSLYQFMVSIGTDDNQLANVEIHVSSQTPPIFTNSIPAQLTIEENSLPLEGVLFTVEAENLNYDQSAEIEYFIAGCAGEGAFDLNEDSGKLRLLAPLDREEDEKIELIIEARSSYFTGSSTGSTRSSTGSTQTTGSGFPHISSFIRLQIDISDVNDVAPIPSCDVINARVKENESPNQVIAQVTAHDPDTGSGGKVEYSINTKLSDVTESDQFVIDSNNGEIRTRYKFDRELKSTYTLVIDLKDGGFPQLTSTCHVVITIDDVNDHPPSFPRLFTTTINEDVAIGHYVITVTSDDEDSDVNSMNLYQLTDDANGTFVINSTTGDVTTAKPLNRDLHDEYRLRVEAMDGSWTSKASIYVAIDDVNNHSPRFVTSQSDGVGDMVRKVTCGASGSVARIQAEDADEGDNGKIYYFLLNSLGLFSINRTSGIISSKHPLICSSMTSSVPGDMVVRHRLLVLASDGGLPFSLTSQARWLSIEVHRVNVHAPVCSGAYHHVAVSQETGRNQTIYRATAYDVESTKIRYSIKKEDVGNIDDYMMVTYDGDVITVTNMHMIPIGTQFDFDIIASDDGVPIKQTTIHIVLEITGPNLYRPRFSRSLYLVKPGVHENQKPGTKVTQVFASDDDQGINGEVFFRINDDEIPFRINELTGEIFTKYPLDYEEKIQYEFQVQVIDRGVNELDSNSTIIIAVIDVDDNKPKFNSSIFNIYVKEDVQPLVNIGRIRAFDEDSYETSVVYYSIAPTNYFSISNLRGNIYLNKNKYLDFERQKYHTFQIFASNGRNTGSGTSSALVIIHVIGVNEFSPHFINTTSSYADVITYYTSSNNSQQAITSFGADDEDDGEDGKVIYSLLSERKEKDNSLISKRSEEEIFYITQQGDVMLKADTESPLIVGSFYEILIICKNPSPITSQDQFDIRRIGVMIKNCCHNTSTCMTSQSTCSCPPGFTGDLCDVNIDECESSPCHHKSICHDHIDHFTCECPPGYTGDLCDVIIDHCSPNPCLNGGTCINETNGSVCQCRFGDLGENCEVPSFNFQWNSFVKLSTNFHQSSISIYLQFATVTSSALLLRNLGESNYFVAVEIVDSRLQISYNNNGGNDVMTREVMELEVDDGKWHEMLLIIRNNFILLQLDHCPGCEIKIDEDFRSLLRFSSNFTFIGAIDDDDVIMNQISTWSFVGCIRNLHINSRAHQLHDGDDVVMTSHMVNIGCDRDDVCTDDVCGDGGECYDVWIGAECKCPLHKSAQFCDVQRTGSSFTGDGWLAFNFSPEYVRRYRNENSHLSKRSTDANEISTIALKLQTTNPRGNLFRMNGRNSNILSIHIEDGRIVVKNGNIFTSTQNKTFQISDGLEHLIEVKLKADNNVNVYVDGKFDQNHQIQHSLLKSFINPQQIKDIYVGGWSSLSEQFQGCLYYVTIDNHLLPLSSLDVRLNSDILRLNKSRSLSHDKMTSSSCDAITTDVVTCNTTCREGFVCHTSLGLCVCSNDLCADGRTCVQTSDGHTCQCVEEGCNDDDHFSDNRKGGQATWVISIIIVMIVVFSVILFLAIYCRYRKKKDFPTNQQTPSVGTKQIDPHLPMTDLSQPKAAIEQRSDDVIVTQGADSGDCDVIIASKDSDKEKQQQKLDDVTTMMTSLSRPDIISTADVMNNSVKSRDDDVIRSRVNNDDDYETLDIGVQMNGINLPHPRYKQQKASTFNYDTVKPKQIYSSSSERYNNTTATTTSTTRFHNNNNTTNDEWKRDTYNKSSTTTRNYSPPGHLTIKPTLVNKQKVTKIAGFTRDETKILGQTPVDFDSSYGSEVAPRDVMTCDVMSQCRKQLSQVEVEALTTTTPPSGYPPSSDLYRPPVDSSDEEGNHLNDQEDGGVATKLDCLHQYGPYFQNVAGLFKQLGSIPTDDDVTPTYDDVTTTTSSRFRPKSTPISKASSVHQQHNNHQHQQQQSYEHKRIHHHHGRRSAPPTSSSLRHHHHVNKLEHYV